MDSVVAISNPPSLSSMFRYAVPNFSSGKLLILLKKSAKMLSRPATCLMSLVNRPISVTCLYTWGSFRGMLLDSKHCCSGRWSVKIVKGLPYTSGRKCLTDLKAPRVLLLCSIEMCAIKTQGFVATVRSHHLERSTN